MQAAMEISLTPILPRPAADCLFFVWQSSSTTRNPFVKQLSVTEAKGHDLQLCSTREPVAER